jgi:hypothetical protein
LNLPPAGATNKTKAIPLGHWPGKEDGAQQGLSVMDQLGRYWTWLEYDPIALAVLIIGLGVVSMLAMSM